MALSDLTVFSEWVRTTATEVLTQQIDLFNDASRGAIVLRAGAHVGDYSDEILFAKIAGLVRRRNAYGTGAQTAKKLTNLTDTMVKVAAGTPPIEMNPGQFRWIQQSPDVAGVTIGQQLAGDMLADMLNTSLAATSAALGQVTGVFNDQGAVGTITPSMLNTTAGKFGDRSAEIAVWVMHSKVMTDFWGVAISNASNLFRYDTINVLEDPFGRRFVISDVPGFVIAGSPTKYDTLGLTPGAIRVDQNNDFDDNVQTTNGDENILRNYQAEWSFELGIQGFQWDKTNGGKSPTDASILTATNWDQYATSIKDLAGVKLRTQ